MPKLVKIVINEIIAAIISLAIFSESIESSEIKKRINI